MAIQVLSSPVLFAPLPTAPFLHTTANITTDAAGESVFAIGHIQLSTGVGTTKTLSSSGGKIHWRTGAVTFSNGSSNLRLGVQDVTAAGVNDDDWTSEPQADLVGGTDTITGSTVMSTAIESGSRNITHGDFIAVGMELTARGGADSIVTVRQSSNIGAYSAHSAVDTGSGPALLAAPSSFVIEFDDGTLGWMDPCVYPQVFESSTVYGTGSTPDEYALVARWPFTFTASGLFCIVANTVAADDFDLILYSDPLGVTPVATKTLVLDSSLYAVSAGQASVSRPFTSSNVTIAANTDYAIAVRPSTANTLSYVRSNLGSGGANIRKATHLGTNWSQYSRSDESGAFGSQDTTLLPAFGIWAVGFDDGTGGGSPTGKGYTLFSNGGVGG